MVPVMDTSMKSSPALSQMSEGEDRGRKSDKMKWVKEKRAMEKNDTVERKKKNGPTTSLCEENEKTRCHFT